MVTYVNMPYHLADGCADVCGAVQVRRFACLGRRFLLGRAGPDFPRCGRNLELSPCLCVACGTHDMHTRIYTHEMTDVCKPYHFAGGCRHVCGVVQNWQVLCRGGQLLAHQARPHFPKCGGNLGLSPYLLRAYDTHDIYRNTYTDNSTHTDTQTDTKTFTYVHGCVYWRVGWSCSALSACRSDVSDAFEFHGSGGLYGFVRLEGDCVRPALRAMPSKAYIIRCNDRIAGEVGVCGVDDTSYSSFYAFEDFYGGAVDGPALRVMPSWVTGCRATQTLRVLPPWVWVQGLYNVFGEYNGWHVRELEQGPIHPQTCCSELGYLHRIRSCCGGIWGCRSTAGGTAGRSRLYVNWPGAGKDTGCCWDVGQSVLCRVAYCLPCLPMYVGIVVGAHVVQQVTCEAVSSSDYFIAISGCPVELLVFKAFASESGWRWCGSCFYIGLLGIGVHFKDVHVGRGIRVPLCECVSMMSVCLSSRHGWGAILVLAIATDVYPSFPVCQTCHSDMVWCSCQRGGPRRRAASSDTPLRGSVGEGGRASGLGGGSSVRGSGVVGMSVEASHRAFSSPPRGGPVTRGAGEFMGDETGRGDRARVRHNSDNSGDNERRNIPHLQTL